MAQVIVIDDDIDMRNLMVRILETQGYVILQAENGRQGLKLIRENPELDLVITDLVMPDLEGIELIRELHAYKKDLPILAISGGVHARTATFLEIAGLLGAKAVLEKPFDLKQFVVTVATLIAE